MTSPPSDGAPRRGLGRGLGALVSASRSLTYADELREVTDLSELGATVRLRVEAMRTDLGRVSVEREIRPGRQVPQRLPELPVADAFEPPFALGGDESLGFAQRVIDRRKPQLATV